MRIADLLLAADDDDDDYNFPSRSILPCWLFPNKRSSNHHQASRRKIAPSKTLESQTRRKTNKEQKQPSDSHFGRGEEEENPVLPVVSSTETAHSSSSSSERHIKDVSFSLGLGVGLVYLTALSKNEINRMMELKTQMEILMKEVKDEMQKKDVLSVTPKSNDILIYPTTNSSGVESIDNHPANENCALSHQLEETNTVECDSYSDSNIPRRQECALGIDHMEAELEAELQYMQFNLAVENLSDNQDHHGKTSSGTYESLSSSGREDEHPQEYDEEEEEHGVSPIELERRLYELIEARQKERIQELESALECAMDELHQKEMEVSWWKDIAQHSLEHVDDDANHLSRSFRSYAGIFG